MKALVYYGNRDIRLEPDWPEPVAGPGEVLLRMSHASICATDIEEWQHGPLWVAHETPNPLSGRMAPLILGHEAAGRVAELGEGVENLRVGDRVAIDNVVTCGSCVWCRKGESAVCPSMAVFGLSDDGGLAEFAKWRASQCIPLPEDVPSEEAPLAEPATVAVHAVRRSGLKVGDTVALIGCGTVGLLTLQVLKAAGARVIGIDIRAASLDLAASLGAEETIDASSADPGAALLDLTGGIGPDITFETSGAARSPVNAVSWARRGGTAVLVGIYSATPEIDFNQVVGLERTVIGSVGASPGDYRRAIDLIAGGQINVKPLISAKIPLDRVIQDGFERMIAPEKDVFRILVGAG